MAEENNSEKTYQTAVQTREQHTYEYAIQLTKYRGCRQNSKISPTAASNFICIMRQTLLEPRWDGTALTVLLNPLFPN